MIYIISGLAGTGKTTLCKRIENEFGYHYVNDWTLFNNNKISLDKFEDKNKISEKYSHMLFNYILKNNDKNLVIDIEYSISPTDFVNSEISNICKIIYLGFVSLSNDVLFNLFKNSSANKNINDKDLLKMIEFYKKISINYQKQCLNNNLEFIDVNKDRNEIIESIINSLNL